MVITVDVKDLLALDTEYTVDKSNVSLLERRDVSAGWCHDLPREDALGQAC